VVWKTSEPSKSMFREIKITESSSREILTIMSSIHQVSTLSLYFINLGDYEIKVLSSYLKKLVNLKAFEIVIQCVNPFQRINTPGISDLGQCVAQMKKLQKFALRCRHKVPFEMNPMCAKIIADNLSELPDLNHGTYELDQASFVYISPEELKKLMNTIVKAKNSIVKFTYIITSP